MRTSPSSTTPSCWRVRRKRRPPPWKSLRVPQTQEFRQLLHAPGRHVVHRKVLADRRAVVGAAILDHPALGIAGAAPGKMQIETRRVGHVACKGDRERHRWAGRARRRGSGRPGERYRRGNRRTTGSGRGAHGVELKGGAAQGTECESSRNRRDLRDLHRRPHNARAR